MFEGQSLWSSSRRHWMTIHFRNLAFLVSERTYHCCLAIMFIIKFELLSLFNLPYTLSRIRRFFGTSWYCPSDLYGIWLSHHDQASATCLDLQWLMLQNLENGSGSGLVNRRMNPVRGGLIFAEKLFQHWIIMALKRGWPHLNSAAEQTIVFIRSKRCRQ